jgi:FMN phosphatase YigB (HAD superfamily)
MKVVIFDLDNCLSPVAQFRGAADLLIVGDSHEAELTAAKSLGIPSVQTVRPSVSCSDIASFHVSGLRELIEVMRSQATCSCAVPLISSR